MERYEKGDTRKYAIAVNSLPFFKTMRDRISIIFECDYIPDIDYHNSHYDSFILQLGIRFRITENIYTTHAYSNNEEFTVEVKGVF